MEDFTHNIISPICQRAGLGWSPDKLKTSQSECTNSVLHDCMKHECRRVKIDKYFLVDTLKKCVKGQEQELELAILDKGEYQLCPTFHHLVVTG